MIKKLLVYIQRFYYNSDNHHCGVRSKARICKACHLENASPMGGIDGVLKRHLVVLSYTLIHGTDDQKAAFVTDIGNALVPPQSNIDP